DPTCSTQSANYANAGVYAVTLTFQPNGSSITKSVGVQPPGGQPDPTPEFTWTPLNPIPAQLLTSTDTTPPPGSVGHWTWAFGDGTSSFLNNPTHTYNVGGQISVALTVANETTGGAGQFVVHLINIGTPPTNTSTASPTFTPSNTPTTTATFNGTPSLTPTATVTGIGNTH